MILSHLIYELQQIARRVHPLTPTNCPGVAFAPEHGVLLEIERERELQDQIEEERVGSKNQEITIAELEKELAKAQADLSEAENLLDEVKHEDEKGATLRHYVSEALAAREHARTWQEGCRRMGDELTQIRKRKGITTNFLQYEGEILRVLRLGVDYPEDSRRFAGEARSLLAKIQAP